jgi:hypothetical protein
MRRTRTLLHVVLLITSLHASTGYGCSPAPLVRAPCRSAAAAVMVAKAEPSLFELIEQRDFRSLVQRARTDPGTLLTLVKEAGIAGALSYTFVELSFFAIALPIGYFFWHASTGEWLKPLLLLQEDGVEGKARLLGLLLSYIVLLKSLFPVRLGSTILLTPVTRRVLDGIDEFRVPSLSDLTASRTAGDSSRRAALKDEVRRLAAQARGGILPFDAADQQAFDETFAELVSLNPTEEPSRSPLFSGEWECLWTTEKELNFAVEKGLLGLPWQRTYQTIDVAAGALENVIQFEGGALRVASTIAPDAEDGARFDFAFERCQVAWRGIQVPLPPVGKGWGELLYLDDEMRIQLDIRGDIVIAERC